MFECQVIWTNSNTHIVINVETYGQKEYNQKKKNGGYGMKKFKIFYSWQSDLPGNKTRNFIRGCIDEAIDLAEESETIEAERDEATSGMTGSPNIVTTLFEKIDNCDLFIADISLCFIESQHQKKKSPNPNVMLELGYAVKKLGWERVICLCNVDYGNEYPFDIAHNRITKFSLEGKTKKEVASELARIIFKNIRDVRKLKPYAKVGMATHIIGAYDFDEHTVFMGLTPIDIANQEGYVLHNQALVLDAQHLVAEIQAIALNAEITVSDDLPAASSVHIQSESPSNLQALVEKFNGSEVPVLWKETDLDKAIIKHWLDIEVSDSFFDLGGLKRVLPAFDILNPSFKGTDSEIKKYEKLRDLEYKLTQLQIRSDYLKSFDNMCFIPLAIQNISATQDENIRVVVNVNAGEIIEPDGHLIWSEFEGIQGLLCRNDEEENDMGVISELFSLAEDGVIHVEAPPYSPQMNRPRMPIFTAHGLAWPEKNDEDYALELQEFIAKTDGRGYYEFDVSTLRAGECKWLCCGLLMRPVDDTISISYQIHSAYSTGDLAGTLEWHKI